MKIDKSDADLRLGETLDITIEIVDPSTQAPLSADITEALSAICTNSAGSELPVAVTKSSQSNVWHISAETGEGSGWTVGVVKLVVWLTAQDGTKQASQNILIEVGD